MTKNAMIRKLLPEITRIRNMPNTQASDIELTRQLLHKIEELGMIPPTVKAKHIEYEDYYPDNYWESE